MLTENFRDMLSELSDGGVEFLVVGAFAMAGHQMMRTTGDLDIWIRPEPGNAQKVWSALARFGAPVGKLSVVDLARPGLFFQIGVAPDRVDVLTEIDGVGFQEAWDARVYRTVDGVRVPILSREHLLRNKKATGRPKDAFDVAWIESRIRKEQEEGE